MDFFDSSYYTVQKALLIGCGAWPFQKKNCKHLILRIIFLNGPVFFILLPEAINLLKSFQGFDYIMACLPLISGSVMGLFKAYVLYFNADSVKILFKELRRDWEYYAHVEDEYSIIKKYAKAGRLSTISYAGSIQIVIMVYLASCCVSPVLDIVLPLNESRPRTTINPGNLYVHTDSYFFVIILMEWYGMATASYLIYTFDSLYMTFMLHTCGMFAALSDRLQKLKMNDFHKKEYKLAKNPDEMIYLHLINCIKLHLRCIKFAERLNSTFNLPFIVDLFFGALIAIASAVQFVISINDYDQRLKYGMLYSTQTMRIFVTSFPGQLLIDHSNYVNVAAYNNEWYEFPEKSKQLLLIFLMRSVQPTEFVVAKMFTMNTDLFNKISRACISYCTVMLSVQNS
ncbi:odorant receptor Or2-like [Prorops nasuta]|uniref:odorant receptor Or2-like n=1 Tax=Prorops nasuta TaxID=863751 RepID=UPI0034CF0EF4